MDTLIVINSITDNLIFALQDAHYHLPIKFMGLETYEEAISRGFEPQDWKERNGKNIFVQKDDKIIVI